MEDCKKVLAIFPSIYLYGKERSNIEVFRILENDNKISLKILGDLRMRDNLKQSLSDFDVIFSTFPDRSNKRFKYIKYLISFIRINFKVAQLIIKNKPDIIYINNEMSIYDLFPILKLCKAEIIYRIGDIPAFPTLSGYKLNYYMWKTIVVKKITTIVSISQFIKNEVDKTGRNNRRDTVIYNYPPSRSESIKINKNKNPQLTIGYLGQIRELKGIHILIDAVVILIKKGYFVKLMIAGDTNLFPEYSCFLKKKIKQEECDNSITFMGEISNVSQFFNQIDLLCIPTIWPEALGNVLVEAKQHYTPVIIFPSGGMPELVRHKIDGFICNDKNKEAIMEAISYYYNNNDILDKHGLNAFNSLSLFNIVKEKFEIRWREVFSN